MLAWRLDIWQGLGERMPLRHGANFCLKIKFLANLFAPLKTLRAYPFKD